MRILIALILVLPTLVTAEIFLHTERAGGFHIRCDNFKSWGTIETKNGYKTSIAGLRGCKKINSGTPPIKPPIIPPVQAGTMRLALRANTAKTINISASTRLVTFKSKYHLAISGQCGYASGTSPKLRVGRGTRCPRGGRIRVYSGINQTVVYTIK